MRIARTASADLVSGDQSQSNKSMIHKEENTREEQLLEVAKAMMTAARTAPKACGVDQMEIITVTGAKIKALAEQMRIIGEGTGRAFFLRDALNIENSGAVVLMGTHEKVRGLNCGLCGFDTCAEKERAAPRTLCSFNINDVGIALGSAAAIAADHRVDNRMMYSAGVAAEALGWLPGCRAIFAIPLSASGKNIYFDRKPHEGGSCAK